MKPAHMTAVSLKRREILCGSFGLVAVIGWHRFALAQHTGAVTDKRWYDAALAMKRLAESWGDQSYGAVLILDDYLIGEGPSRVVQRGDGSAHAEREAIRDAQRRLNRTRLDGSILYSTSRPCSACESAAAAAGVSRMYFGESLRDAGVPKSRE